MPPTLGEFMALATAIVSLSAASACRMVRAVREVKGAAGDRGHTAGLASWRPACPPLAAGSGRSRTGWRLAISCWRLAGESGFWPGLPPSGQGLRPMRLPYPAVATRESLATSLGQPRFRSRHERANCASRFGPVLARSWDRAGPDRCRRAGLLARQGPTDFSPPAKATR
jgi:hypothetical protein